MNTTKKFLLTVSALTLALLTLAQTTLAVGASPLKMEYQAVPGSNVTGTISVYNTSDTTQKIIIQKSDFDMDEQSEGVEFVNNPEDYPYSLQDWISLPEEDIIVGPQQMTTVRYKISIPEDAAAQGYYGALFVGSEPYEEDSAEDTGGIGVQLRTQVAHLVLLDVEGSVQDVSLKDFTIDESAINKPLEEVDDGIPFFDIVVYNDGNVHSSPEGTIEIIDEMGNTVNQLDLNTGQSNVLPHKTKTYFSEGYVKDVPAGTYYAVLDGKAENGQQLQGQVTFAVDRQGKVELLEKEIGAVDITSLKGAAQQNHVAFQTALAILAIAIFTVAFLAIGKYCIVSSKECKSGGKKTKTKKRKSHTFFSKINKIFKKK